VVYKQGLAVGRVHGDAMDCQFTGYARKALGKIAGEDVDFFI
jgi:hypothetical protein